ncbi:sugar lactone lactonase YvrE [Spinactinospora alkalitolerans]|uniref:Sugar lactone lactonase YvrE n=1 Tax=Spinactinospora alkalitolerans TaxID=687207 RepID=A0A852TW62_9ACTN|nr:SMP-30/gluconolactonase/LRE family protein [Spinactinospora alkalitolerans]NYE48168.1 sugar lactone lactonase YvrE [Spinactinospora alkalitolerans]
MAVEQVTPPVADHGEGPVWCADEGRLRWVDMLAGDVLALDPGSGEIERTHVAEVAAALRPRIGGGFVVAVERGFALWEPGEPRPRLLPEVWADPSVRMNEGGCDPRGRFYCGSMAYDAAPGRGALHRLDPDGTVTTVLEGVTISNGLAWTPDGRRAYYVDTPTRRVDVFGVDPGTGDLVGREPVVEVPAGSGSPDGLCLDAEGGIWVALWDGAAVHRYTAEGVLDEVVELPVPRPTACAFGGPGLRDLYVTTSGLDLDPARHPEAGAVFRLRPGVRGTPVLPFGG